ncbi:type III polyketide synthase [Microbacterium thalassium]|uniref:Putative naringenin-chalcone synthase n=1 Tax=Microbacterium thalassium TaxID=362649 RepID=A0A7X0FTI6_9MICO|nr:type III polyketide synthase [Microbacterium thalassium]MBB6392726.1 putative naringenin-chalcone synthase [Microbacterium thalassium]GLK23042.1 naringenin-chalcone synthase [Microbacterium thalassium]
MTARIVSIGTAVPETRLDQQRARDFFAAQPGADRLAQRRIRAVFDASAIEQRYTVLSQLADPAAPPADRTDGIDGLDFVDESVLLSPATGARNDTYRRLAPALSASAAGAALADAGIAASAVTHVVTVSCTGFFAPGPDYRLVRDLGLPGTAQRSHLGFIGCAAALPALRLAAQITGAEPGAVVLVAATELCTLHVRDSTDPQQIVASSVFADGAAAAVITADAATGAPGGLELDRFGTALTSEGEADMVWSIGDHGFEMILSAEVPRIVGREIRGALDRFLAGDPPPDAWAVHPGGRSVLDRVEAGLDLDPEALATSRAVLRDFGNMSSATILFILRAMLHDDALRDGTRVAALAFGPGLTVESALLTKRSPAAA